MTDASDSSILLSLRALAREAGVGDVSAPAPIRLDDLDRRLNENRARVASLEARLAKAS